jgi:hypothetical protein
MEHYDDGEPTVMQELSGLAYRAGYGQAVIDAQARDDGRGDAIVAAAENMAARKFWDWGNGSEDE